MAKTGVDRKRGGKKRQGESVFLNAKFGEEAEVLRQASAQFQIARRNMAMFFANRTITTLCNGIAGCHPCPARAVR